MLLPKGKRQQNQLVTRAAQQNITFIARDEAVGIKHEEWMDVLRDERNPISTDYRQCRLVNAKQVQSIVFSIYQRVSPE